MSLTNLRQYILLVCLGEKVKYKTQLHVKFLLTILNALGSFKMYIAGMKSCMGWRFLHP